MLVKRLFDVLASGLGLIILSPCLLLVAMLIKLDSPGPVFYRGVRIGRSGKPFKIIKFRTMIKDAEAQGPLGTPEGDPRITRAGKVLRDFKLDELPQLLNVLKGDMSLVGPRPEAALYLQYYREEDKRAILSVRPGMTDYGSLRFHDEGKLLRESHDPVKSYIETIKDEKVKLQLEYIHNMSLAEDLKVIFLTIATILRTRLRRST